MKYCTDCGEGLPQPNPKFCPGCGGKISVKSSKEAEPQVDGSKKAGNWALGIFLAVVFVIILFYFSIIQPFIYGWQVETAGTQYYQYFTAFQKDRCELDFLGRQYDYVELTNESFPQKAQAASRYATKASQAIATWDYVDSFVGENRGLLTGWNVSASNAQSDIANSKLAVQNKVKSIAEELEKFPISIRADGADETIKILNEIGR